MKKTLPILLLIVLLTACAPTTVPTSALTQMSQPSETPIVTDQPTAIPEPSPVEQIQAEPTKKPKGQNQPVAPTSTNADFIATEILGRPTDTSVTVNIIPAVDMEVVITYGTDSATFQTDSVALKANMPQEIQLSNLAPDTAYFYEVIPVSAGDTINNGMRHTFHTARAQGSAFTFAIQGDSHPRACEEPIQRRPLYKNAVERGVYST